MSALLLVQMSGVPGAGKSTVAREIGRRLPAVVIDHDLLKTALIEHGLPFAETGGLSYAISRTLTTSFLEQGLNVVLDSPCYYPEILDSGLRIAAAAGACYRYVECVTEDLAEVSRRLRDRAPLRSQRMDLHLPPRDRGGGEELTGEELFREWMANMKRPAHAYLRLDTSRPLGECLAEVFAFLDECRS